MWRRRRVLFELLKNDCNRRFQLWVSTADYQCSILRNLDICDVVARGVHFEDMVSWVR